MGRIELNKRRILILVAAVVAFLILLNGLTFHESLKDAAAHIPLPVNLTPTVHKPYVPIEQDDDDIWDLDDPDHPEDPQSSSSPPPPSSPPASDDGASPPTQPNEPAPPVKATPDSHPITQMMEDADKQWRIYESSVSTTFRQTVEKYRSTFGRHPPPAFKDWYKFARERNVFNIDDFQQVMDDLRPFWSVNASDIRIHAAHMAENPKFGAAVISIRKHKVANVLNGSWRSETMVKVINTFVKYLPDMDIAMNRLDQPRLLVPWEDLQEMLSHEYKSRAMHPEVMDSFTSRQPELLDFTIEDPKDDPSTRLDQGWFFRPGKQYMEVVSKACPPESPARSNLTIAEADAMYKDPASGIVNNFNLSSDLCTVGPAIQDLHGMLYSSSSMIVSHKLVPIFGECKVNVNNDILFPANMYYLHDVRYDYDPKDDLDWRDKKDDIIWRGVTSGGVQLSSNWATMHRQRLVQLFNGTHVKEAGVTAKILTQKRDGTTPQNSTYEPVGEFEPSQFANDHGDIGFVEAWGCVPNCSFYDSIFSWKPQVPLTSQFKSRYLIDIDGHSFSGRWHAFLQSKSLGLKATIFREWHDSRLFAWRHFVPVDNRYDDLYALLTYFIGYGRPNMEHALETGDANPQVYIPPHTKEAQTLAKQGREWANKSLRREDIEVYMFRLLLEYGRLIDDNRDYIGYSGDGSELDKYDAGEEGRWGIGGWK